MMVGVLQQLVNWLGPAAGVVGFYLRQSGLPIPVAEHALPVYLGHQYASSPFGLVVAWLALIALSIAGSSNLYLIGRRWGASIASGAVGQLLRLDAARLVRVERWYRRWGWAAVMVGAHVPGVRVAALVSAGALGVRYRVFAAAIAATMAPRLALGLWVGVTFGSQIANYLNVHTWVYVVGGAAVALVLIGIAWRVRAAALSLPSADTASSGESLNR
jgi:membrane protein DedA with SNARE-associated domain